MRAALHGRDGNTLGIAYHELASVSDGGGAREGRNLRVGNANCVRQSVGKGAKAGAEDKRDLRAKRGLRSYELSGGLSSREIVGGHPETVHASGQGSQLFLTASLPQTLRMPFPVSIAHSLVHCP